MNGVPLSKLIEAYESYQDPLTQMERLAEFAQDKEATFEMGDFVTPARIVKQTISDLRNEVARLRVTPSDERTTMPPLDHHIEVHIDKDMHSYAEAFDIAQTLFEDWFRKESNWDWEMNSEGDGDSEYFVAWAYPTTYAHEHAVPEASATRRGW